MTRWSVVCFECAANFEVVTPDDEDPDTVGTECPNCQSAALDTVAAMYGVAP
jgi:predicted nucleic acid-binding Zn ribbon protein